MKTSVKPFDFKPTVYPLTTERYVLPRDAKPERATSFRIIGVSRLLEDVDTTNPAAHLASTIAMIEFNTGERCLLSSMFRDGFIPERDKYNYNGVLNSSESRYTRTGINEYADIPADIQRVLIDTYSRDWSLIKRPPITCDLDKLPTYF